MEGWIKLDRKIMLWEWYKNPIIKSLFTHLILSANHKDGRWEGIDLKRGQVIVGRYELSRDTGLSEQQIRTALKKLQSTKEIDIKSTNRFSIITICKYEDYQSSENFANQQTTNDQPTDNQQLTTNKNANNAKKERKKYSPAKPEPELPFKSDAFVFAWNEWEIDRKERNKRITHGAKTRQFNFLKKKTEAEAIEIINHAIQQGWQGLYEIKHNRQRKSGNPGKLQ